jgi:hypothetical protein
MLTRLSLNNFKRDTRVSGMLSKEFLLRKDPIIFSKTLSHFSSNTVLAHSRPFSVMIG